LRPLGFALGNTGSAGSALALGIGLGLSSFFVVFSTASALDPIIWLIPLALSSLFLSSRSSETVLAIIPIK